MKKFLRSTMFANVDLVSFALASQWMLYVIVKYHWALTLLCNFPPIMPLCNSLWCNSHFGIEVFVFFAGPVPSHIVLFSVLSLYMNSHFGIGGLVFLLQIHSYWNGGNLMIHDANFSVLCMIQVCVVARLVLIRKDRTLAHWYLSATSGQMPISLSLPCCQTWPKKLSVKK